MRQRASKLIRIGTSVVARSHEFEMLRSLRCFTLRLDCSSLCPQLRRMQVPQAALLTHLPAFALVSRLTEALVTFESTCYLTPSARPFALCANSFSARLRGRTKAKANKNGNENVFIRENFQHTCVHFQVTNGA